MMQLPPEFEGPYQALSEELFNMGAFRRGSITERYRKCVNPACACARKGHSGHGPQTILTFKEQGTTRTVNLPSPAAVELVRGQIAEHEHFLDWAKRWRALQEAVSVKRLRETLASPPDTPPESEDARKKKLPRASKPKLRGKSKRSSA
jgi:hypothetical protein